MLFYDEALFLYTVHILVFCILLHPFTSLHILFEYFDMTSAILGRF